MDRSESCVNPIQPFLDQQGFVMLDGGLATTLEAHGCDLNDPLWSAKILLESPAVVTQVHLAFLEAGADCIASVSYQATIEGFVNRGLPVSEATALLCLSTAIACNARDAFWADEANRTGRLEPLVGASIGPYGAYLADGSEYVGNYELDEDALYAFHAERWRILSESDVDLIACETIPSLPEARALLRLIAETPDRWAWLSFSCRNEQQISDGTPVAELARICNRVPGVIALGVNCVEPTMVEALIHELNRVTEKPIVVYPNSGERYDAGEKVWTGRADAREWSLAEWRAAGASLIGGCCRVPPEAIRAMRNRLERSAT